MDCGAYNKLFYALLAATALHLLPGLAVGLMGNGSFII